MQDVKPGDSILLADGEIELAVSSTTETDATCEVIVGGELGSNKGISAPSVVLKQAIPTPKDIKDVIFGIEHGVDWMAQSFVRSADELHALREIIRQNGSDIPIIAKLEKHEALDNLDEIIKAADGVMIARGGPRFGDPASRSAHRAKGDYPCFKSFGQAGNYGDAHA